ncbi:energy-coupling factor transporter transmembrane component T family protein [Clostridium porci]|uniref:Energy-coupling factor transporter transmembrane protein EcfT n=1 Tax=Clostridium porci TaxID=2605778 RepID=A0A7X2TED7_9CLOT|nr:energy-coupling factor transporter transmembrane component T [Clostridium porci]MSS38485.1 energy-coupling factor transporter transmembrane protein EcfT [Clostridium porci]
MNVEKTKTKTAIDPRTWLVHLLIGVAAIILIHSNIGGLWLFAWCMLLQLAMRKGQYTISFLFVYIILTGFAWIGVQLLPDDRFYFLGLAFSNMGVIGRKAIVPLSFAVCLAKEPTGSLIASLQAMRLPKAVGIGLAVLLRFFPTIGGEYRAIRASQRFRGIGVGILYTLTHLPSTAEYILIPLILRTTKVAEELSASMTVRGVHFSGKTISYRPVRFTGKDAALCVIALLIPLTVFLLERRGIF